MWEENGIVYDDILKKTSKRKEDPGDANVFKKSLVKRMQLTGPRKAIFFGRCRLRRKD